jgi:hypothetical protein
MATLGFIPSIWSGEILTTLEKSHVFGMVANRNYEGEIKDFGDTVKINMIGDITISSYTPNSTTISYAQLMDAQKELKIDQKKYFGFVVDDVINAQTKPKLVAPAMQKAAWGLRDVADQFLASKYTDAGIQADLGTEATGIDITSVNVTEYMGLVSQKLDEGNVPSETRWMVIPPWFKQKLILAKVALDTNNSETLVNGFVGRYMGFNLYVSNNVSVKTAASNTGSRILAGYAGSITFAEQLLKIRSLEDKDSFGQYVSGLYVYGGKVVQPETLACLRADYTVEP